MKRRITFLALCSLIMANAYSQDWSGYSSGKIYPGYIIKTDGTKVEGYIEGQALATPSDSPFGNSNQSRVVFYTDSKNKKTKSIYKPEDLKEYKMADKIYRSISYSGGLTSKALRFVLLAEDGAIARYFWYDNTGSYAYPAYESKDVFHKKNEKPFDGSILTGFAKKMSEMVSDYPELSSKIANKEKGYGFVNIYSIIEEYNKWHETQNNE